VLFGVEILAADDETPSHSAFLQQRVVLVQTQSLLARNGNCWPWGRKIASGRSAAFLLDSKYSFARQCSNAVAESVVRIDPPAPAQAISGS
jgi:hypothetical protein